MTTDEAQPKLQPITFKEVADIAQNIGRFSPQLRGNYYVIMQKGLKNRHEMSVYYRYKIRNAFTQQLYDMSTHIGVIQDGWSRMLKNRGDLALELWLIISAAMRTGLGLNMWTVGHPRLVTVETPGVHTSQIQEVIEE